MERIVESVKSLILNNNNKLKSLIRDNNSTLVPNDKPTKSSIYQIHTNDTSICDKYELRKCQLGTAVPGSTEKVVMMVGATGSGKSTMINAMFNHIVGVKWKDSFRFKLVNESVQGTQADSQTKGITAYTLHYQDGFAVPYTLTIVDTPGFDDTRGREHDKEITERIRMFFTNTGDAGIDHIDAVGIVLKAPDARLTENQKYIFHSILSLWGNDIEENIFMFFSNADRQKPAAYAALKSANIPHKKETCFKFNNGTLFDDDESDDEDDEDDEGFAAVYWKMNDKGFNHFLMKHLVKVNTKSLTLSQAVLELRHILEICHGGNKKDIQDIVLKQEQLRRRIEVLEKHRTDLEKNKYFTYTETIQEITEVPIDHKTAVNCSECKRTCHYPCKAIWTPYICSIFWWSGECTICSCSQMKHTFQDFKYEKCNKKITKTNEDLRRQFLDAEGKTRSVLAMVEVAEKQLRAIEKKCFGLMMVQRLIIETLHEIALHPASQSTDKTAGWKERDYTIYIETLILFEKQEKMKGWPKRIQQLQELQTSMSLVKMERSEKLGCIQQMIETEEKEAKEGWEERTQPLQELQKSWSLYKTAGWKERYYIEQIIQTEIQEEKEGWKKRFQQLKELQQKSEELSQEWNIVLDQITQEVDLQLISEDNKNCKKLQKIVEFKKKVYSLAGIEE